jgi:hypothetical protein
MSDRPSQTGSEIGPPSALLEQELAREVWAAENTYGPQGRLAGIAGWESAHYGFSPCFVSLSKPSWPTA